MEIPSDYDSATSVRKPSGHILMDGQEIAQTIQCCHCGGHFVSIKGSGKVRGFCMCCHKITCGDPKCNPCVPFEKKLDDYEIGQRSILR